MTALDFWICPCCEQKIIIYKRWLRKTLIEWLKVIDDKWPLNWRKTWVTDIKILKHWGLIYSLSNNNIWITNKWKNFLKNKISIPEYIYLKNGILQDRPKEEINPYIYITEIKDKRVTKENILQDSL